MRKFHAPDVLANGRRRGEFGKFLVSTENAREAAVVTELSVYAVAALTQAVGLLTGQETYAPITARLEDLAQKLNTYDIDFSDVRGQEFAKRALVVAAAGGHNVLTF